MGNETTFQKNIKWFAIGASGAVAFCHFILLFYEFSIFSGLGIMINGLYHLVSLSCPALIIFMLIKNMDDKEVYISYGIALQIIIGAMVDICLLVKYITLTNGTEGISAVIITFTVLLILLEGFFSFCFVKYGLDKVTGLVPLLLSFFIYIYRGSIYSLIDSKFSVYAYNSIEKSFFSIWSFMSIMFGLAMITCIVLYNDSQTLYDIITNPRELFTKNTLFGTYTNLYMNENKKDTNNLAYATNETTNVDLNNMASNNSNINTTTVNEPVDTINNQNITNIPVTDSNVGNDVLTNNISNENDNNKMMIEKKCPHCSAQLVGDESTCPNCGFNLTWVNNTIKDNKSPKKFIPIIIGAILLMLIFLIIPYIKRRIDYNNKQEDMTYALVVETAIVSSLSNEKVYNEVVMASVDFDNISLEINRGNVKSDCSLLSKSVESYLEKNNGDDVTPKYKENGADHFRFVYSVTSNSIVGYYCDSKGQTLNQFYPAYSNSNLNSASNSSYCTMCGGEMKCAICGESGLYCEYASYGSGSDHYCSKHWGDVVEWHESQKDK
jgi:hypothetical protein